jgi:ABC-type spermidine/putrescine transport system permease subunit II
MSPLEIARAVLLIAHILGLAAIIGPFILQLRTKHGFRFAPMLTGAIVQVVTGIGLVAVREMGDLDVNNAKIGVKMAIALIVLVAVIVAVVRQRRAIAAATSDRVSLPWMHVAGAGAILNVIVAVAWV